MSKYSVGSLVSYLRDNFEYTQAHLEHLRIMVERSDGLDKKQIMEALVWMALCDGHVNAPVGGNCLLSISHKPASEDYLIWKSSIIEHFTSCNIKSYWHSRPNQESYQMLVLTTKAHPWFTKVRKILYGDLGRKCLPPHALALLGPLGLAIAYQDDGSLSIKPDGYPMLRLHLECFSQLELEAFAKSVVDKFGIIFRVSHTPQRGMGFMLTCRAKDVPKFLALVEPYIVPSMQYKLGAGSIS